MRRERAWRWVVVRPLRIIDGDADGKLDTLVFFALDAGLEGAAEHGDDGLTRVLQNKVLDDSEDEYLDFEEG
jgi:hypothetical protein